MFNNTTAGKKSSKSLKREVIDATCELKSDIENSAHEAGEKVRHLYENANQNFSEMRDNVSGRINEKPVQSAAIALVAGFLLSSILRRI